MFGRHAVIVIAEKKGIKLQIKPFGTGEEKIRYDKGMDTWNGRKWLLNDCN